MAVPVAVTATTASTTLMLAGRQTVSSADGVATFDSLVVVGRPGRGVVTFSAPGLESGLTLAVDVTAGAPAGLAVTRQPDSAAIGGRLRVQPVVELRDAADNAAQGSLTVQAELVGGGALTGATTAAVVGGRATFTDLGVDSAAAGARALRFSVRGLAPALSSTFTVRTTERAAMVLGPGAPVSLATWAGRAAPATAAVTVADGGLARATGLAVSTQYGEGPFTGWLQTTLDARNAPTVLRFSGAAGLLPAGRYEATVRLSAAAVGEAATAPVLVPVTLVVDAVRGRVAYGAPSNQLLLAPGGRAAPATRVVPVVPDGELQPADVRVRYLSRSPSVATVDAQGAVTAGRAGQAWVVATAADSGVLADSVVVSVTRAADSPLVTLELPRTQLAPGERVEVPVVLDGRGRRVSAASLVVAWPMDPSVGFLDLVSSSASRAGVVVNAPASAGSARVTFASGDGAAERVELARLVFQVRGGTSGRVGLLAVTPLAIVGADASNLTPLADAVSLPVASR